MQKRRIASIVVSYLIRYGQQHFVQLLHQLFEGRSLGGNSVPALTHHHVAAEEKGNIKKIVAQKIKSDN